MNIISVLVIGLALSMDAFGVSLAIGINDEKDKNKYIILFGLFQFLFAFCGGYLGCLFDTYIVSIPKVLGGIIIGIVGILMILEGRKEDKSKISKASYMAIILSISVSIDALVVGFTTLHRVGGVNLLLLYSCSIGLITNLMCTVSFIISKYLKRIQFVSKYSELFGGIILICFGLKMIFT